VFVINKAADTKATFPAIEMSVTKQILRDSTAHEVEANNRQVQILTNKRP